MLRARLSLKIAIFLHAFVLASGTAFLSAPLPAVRAGGAHRTDPSVIRITPPAPSIDNQARLAELAARRAQVARSIGSKNVLVLFSAEPRLYTNDVNFLYRQENNLYYLTQLK